jgi:hypothetical protein
VQIPLSIGVFATFFNLLHILVLRRLSPYYNSRKLIEKFKKHLLKRLKPLLKECLGKVTLDLILKTLELVYNIDEDMIIEGPALFEEMLESSVAEVILKS